MKLILKLAWRSIWRNWRRSLITILAVFFATLLSIAMRGMQIGIYEVNIKNAVEMFSGYLQVQRNGFQDNQTLSRSFKDSDEIKNALKANDHVTGFSPRIYANGLIGRNKGNSFGAAIFGVDPVQELRVSKLHEKIKDGKFLNKDSIYQVVVGYKLLKNLDLEIGDEVVILSSGFDGSTGNYKYRIVGTSRFGNTEMDAMSIFMRLDAAKELLTMNDRYSVYTVSIDDMKNLQETQNELKSAIKDTSLTVLNWEEIMPSLKQSIEFDNVSGIVYLGFLVIIVAFGILNTVVMSITERFREFGVMLALGTKNIKLTIIVFFETIFMTLIGVLAGNIVGYILNYCMMKNPIDLSGDMAEMYEQFGFLPQLHSTVAPEIFISTSISIFVIALLVYIYPAYRLSKLEALKGIRYT